MPNYVMRPKADVEDYGYYDASTMTVVEQDREFDTGLVDSDGRPIYRVDGVPMGFVRSRCE